MIGIPPSGGLLGTANWEETPPVKLTGGIILCIPSVLGTSWDKRMDERMDGLKEKELISCEKDID